MRISAFLAITALLIVGCARSDVAPPSATTAASSVEPTAVPSSAAATASPAPTPTPRLYAKLRVFVASESTDSVWVLEGGRGGQFALAEKIKVGRMPHQLSVSPDARWIAVNNRMAGSTSIIDPFTLAEVTRLRVGKQPHGIIWSVDGRTLFVAHERENYIARFEAGTWNALPPLIVGVPQHVLALSAARPNELWFTVTNSSELDHLRMYDLETKKITRVKVDDVHDAYFTPDGSEIWTTSSGFIGKPSDRVVVHDPLERRVKHEIRFPGRYPFHTLKAFQDGAYFPADPSVMVLSDHIGPALLFVDWRERRVLGETKLGQQPFHSTYDPEGARMLVTTNVDGMVNVIDLQTRAVVQKIPVTRAHGIASVGMP